MSRLEDSGSVYAYERRWKGRRLLVACSFTDQTVPCDATEEFPGAKELICNYDEHVKGVLKPYEARVILG